MFRTFSNAALLGLLTISAAYAQNTTPVQAHIPFTFTVGHRTMPAGTYRLTYNYNSDVLSITGLDRPRTTAFVLAPPDGSSETTGSPAELVFHCYGQGACALATVVESRDIGGRSVQLPEPAREERLAMVRRTVPALIAEK